MRSNLIGRIMQKVGGMLRGGRTTGSAASRPAGATTTGTRGGIGSLIRRVLR